MMILLWLLPTLIRAHRFVDGVGWLWLNHRGPFVEPPVGERSFAGLRILVEGVDGIGGDIMHDPNAFLRHFDGTNHTFTAVGTDDARHWWTVKGTCSGEAMNKFTFPPNPHIDHGGGHADFTAGPDRMAILRWSDDSPDWIRLGAPSGQPYIATVANNGDFPGFWRTDRHSLVKWLFEGWTPPEDVPSTHLPPTALSRSERSRGLSPERSAADSVLGVYVDSSRQTTPSSSFAGYRYLAAGEAAPSAPAGHLPLTLAGSDAGAFWWTLDGAGTRSADGTWTVAFDFVPKGGKGVLTGSAAADGSEIVWSDGNVWRKLKVPPHAEGDAHALMGESSRAWRGWSAALLVACATATVVATFVRRAYDRAAGGRPRVHVHVLH